MEGDQRLQALDLVFAERAQHPPGRLLAVGVPHDQLRDHRVVHRRDFAARADARVDAHARAARLSVGADLARRRGEVLGGVLGVDPALDRVPAQLDVLLGVGQLLAGGRSDALLDDVDAGRHLGHAVLDLHARVHLQEEVLGLAAPSPSPRTGPRSCRRRRSRRPSPRPRRSARCARASAASTTHSGAGDSSITFWWRRWIEQSRSPRWITLPWRSASTWTSTWRGSCR